MLNFYKKGKRWDEMKKYLLLVEDERLWEKFKELLRSDINSEIIDLIKKKVEGKEKKG